MSTPLDAAAAKARKAAYRAAHREEIRTYSAKYREENRERILAYDAKRRAEKAAYQRAYSATPDRIGIAI
jgi:hypothetical protein